MLFWIGNNRGKLYDEFKKLDPQKIVRELDVNHWDPKQIVFIAYKLAIYGGLHLQRTLRDKKTIRYANQDMIFIEGVAYTWASIHRMLSSQRRSVLREESEILKGIHVGGGVLAEILSKHSGLRVGSEFCKPYEVESSAEVFSERLLKIPKSKEKDPLNDQISAALVAQIFSATVEKAILESVNSMIEMYLQSSDRPDARTSHQSAKPKITSEMLFALCINSAKRFHLKIAEFDSPSPKTDGMSTLLAKDLEKHISIQCLLHSYALITHCMLSADRNYLGTALDSEFGTSIMSNLVRLDMASFNLSGSRATDTNAAISRQKPHMKRAVELAVHMLNKEKFEGPTVLEAGVKLFCSKVHKFKAENLYAIEQLSREVIAETDVFISQNT